MTKELYFPFGTVGLDIEIERICHSEGDRRFYYWFEFLEGIAA